MPFTPKRMTADEFFALPPEIPRSELIDGVMVEVLHSLHHQRLGLEIARSLLNWVEEHADGPPVRIGCTFRTSDYGVLIPEISLQQEGAPDLAVEVRSYAAWLHRPGPQEDAELWVVDTRDDKLQVYRGGESWELGGGDTLTTPLLPGFAIDLTSLFDR